MKRSIQENIKRAESLRIAPLNTIVDWDGTLLLVSPKNPHDMCTGCFFYCEGRNCPIRHGFLVCSLRSDQSVVFLDVAHVLGED